MSPWRARLNSLMSAISGQEPRPAVERRERRAADRIVFPACPRCHGRGPAHVTQRSSYAVYFECQTCHEVVILRKPRR
jgi:hypothetical protein